MHTCGLRLCDSQEEKFAPWCELHVNSSCQSELCRARKKFKLFCVCVPQTSAVLCSGGCALLAVSSLLAIITIFLPSGGCERRICTLAGYMQMASGWYTHTHRQRWRTPFTQIMYIFLMCKVVYLAFSLCLSNRSHPSLSHLSPLEPLCSKHW